MPTACEPWPGNKNAVTATFVSLSKLAIVCPPPLMVEFSFGLGPDLTDFPPFLQKVSKRVAIL
jgi:hypothetical protein